MWDTLNADDRAAIARVPVFAGLGEPARDHLLAHARSDSVAAGTVLFLQGEDADRFFVVLAGWIKLSRLTADGNQAVIGIFARGDSFAEAAIFDSGEFPVTAEAVSAARVLVVPAKPLLAAIHADPRLALNVMAAMSRRMRYLVAQLEQLQGKSAPQRLGAFLLRLVPDAAGPARLRLPYDKSLIAARLGMKPETFSRSLAKLRELGVHNEGHDVIVAEPARLRRFCDDVGRP